MPEDKYNRINIEGFSFLDEREIENLVNLEELRGLLYSRLDEVFRFIKANFPENTPKLRLFLKTFEISCDPLLGSLDTKKLRHALRDIDKLVNIALDLQEGQYIPQFNPYQVAFMMFIDELWRFKRMVSILEEYSGLTLEQIRGKLSSNTKKIILYFYPKLSKTLNEFDEQGSNEYKSLRLKIKAKLASDPNLSFELRSLIQGLCNLRISLDIISRRKLDREIVNLKNFVRRELVSGDLEFSKEEQRFLKIFTNNLRLAKDRFNYLIKKEQ